MIIIHKRRKQYSEEEGNHSQPLIIRAKARFCLKQVMFTVEKFTSLNQRQMELVKIGLQYGIKKG